MHLRDIHLVQASERISDDLVPTDGVGSERDGFRESDEAKDETMGQKLGINSDYLSIPTSSWWYPGVLGVGRG